MILLNNSEDGSSDSSEFMLLMSIERPLSDAGEESKEEAKEESKEVVIRPEDFIVNE
jgi:hypothetical protein